MRSAWDVRTWRLRRGGLGIHGTRVPLFGYLAIGNQHRDHDRNLSDGLPYPEHPESRFEGDAA